MLDVGYHSHDKSEEEGRKQDGHGFLKISTLMTLRNHDSRDSKQRDHDSEDAIVYRQGDDIQGLKQRQQDEDNDKRQIAEVDDFTYLLYLLPHHPPSISAAIGSLSEHSL